MAIEFVLGIIDCIYGVFRKTLFGDQINCTNKKSLLYEKGFSELLHGAFAMLK